MWHIFNTDILHMYLTPNTYCVTSGLPACRTDLPVSVCVLEGLDQSQRLVHGAPDREIIHGDLAQRSFRINDKQTPEKKNQQTPYHGRSKAWQKDVRYHFNFYRKRLGIKYIVYFSLFLWTCQLFGHTICRSFNHHKHNNSHHAFLTELEQDRKMQSVGRGAHTKLTWVLTWDCDLDPGGTLHKL